MSRRRFLKLAGGATIAGLTGLAGWRFVTNETEPVPDYSTEELIPFAIASLAGSVPRFGTHPDFDRGGFDPWGQMDWVRQEAGRENYAGVFATVEYFRDRSWTTAFFQMLERIAARGTEPVIGLGYGHAIDGYHPFDPAVRSQRRADAASIMSQLEAFGYPLTVRLFYEMNLPAFRYGRGRELNDAQHEQGYKEAFADFARARTSDRISLSFNPAVHNFFMRHPFEGYWPTEDGELLAQSAGIDAYHLFPGKQRFDHPYYWIPGQYSPEAALLSSFHTLDTLTAGQIPWLVWELGSLSKNARWLAHALLLTLASGGQGIMHFNYDKSHMGLPYEGDWTIDPPIASAYRTTLDRLAVA